MPCSCKKNKPQEKQLVQTVTKDNKVQNKPVQLNFPESDSFDFTATTQPLDTCYYCAMKHIALANAVMQFDDNFTIAGELQLAGYHYNTANKAMSDKCKQYARKAITDKELVYRNLPELMKQSVSLDAVAVSDKELHPGDLNYDSVASAVHLAAAFSMMYTELFYQHVNKGFAVGELVLAAVNIQKLHRDIAKHIREAWKVLQEIVEPNDQYYVNAREKLLSIKQQLLNVIEKETTSIDTGKKVEAPILPN